MLPRDAPHRELFKSGLKIDFRAQEKKLEQNGTIVPYDHLRVNKPVISVNPYLPIRAIWLKLL